ncbi:2-amino-4-hydroxy-6-hydroxymethyldihydropteridine diphosphokinase [Sporosarcina sp. P26b]|uniref:2-amino-4-hydroxy-6- hydroxymethyldihydropteridine diphosphokinase n=1 Tax=Sporosarcina TaxID=1569 RepID=UPI000A17D44A|nr:MULTISPECIES: 2-amino-4-hydroxy-6-hydroxymethyldihydropteridine diphosphokinase [Sporosarcina]ARK21846.1 2-amino-4-hydroxy-6-hydroxymethyldihydropteridine pyrophosphokinase [Sporosarcina ureae]PIC72711.1 2-amino-4-hydroxy-6-hydroxymethyldihydropteridine diphosphokinase [Sporosarcina sp. P17b]PIC94556.1 2-amino-4-hydroxy-6-hydroxymethyldihydropteridine diphosphokinase [Sporosarcina sp. P26b]
MNNAYLSLGSNIGNRLEHLQQAVELLNENPSIKALKVSSVYETEPVGLTEQAKFLNIVVNLETTLEATELLSACQSIENKLGRMRKIRWGPRTVDLDILLYNEEHIQLEHLIIPHIRMQERAFVLVPLVEINPEVKNPITGRLYNEEPAIKEDGVNLWKKIVRIEEFLQ